MRAHVPRVTTGIRAPQTGDGIDDRARDPVHAVAPIVYGAQAAKRETQEAGKIIDVPPAVGVRLTQTDAASPQHKFVDARVVHDDTRAQRRLDPGESVTAMVRVT